MRNLKFQPMILIYYSTLIGFYYNLFTFVRWKIFYLETTVRKCWCRLLRFDQMSSIKINYRSAICVLYNGYFKLLTVYCVCSTAKWIFSFQFWSRGNFWLLVFSVIFDQDAFQTSPFCRLRETFFLKILMYFRLKTATFIEFFQMSLRGPLQYFYILQQNEC